MGHPSAIFVRNTTAKNLAASITLNWRGDSGKGQVNLPELNLMPYATRQLQINAMQKQLGIPGDAHWALVTLTTNGMPDDVIAVALSYDASGRYGADAPFTNGHGGYFAGGEWKLDATHDELATVTNGGTKPADALLTLHYDNGAKKYELQQSIAPGEQMWVNLADLVHNRVADRKGNLLPAGLASVTYDVQDLGAVLGHLAESDLAIDNTWGHHVRGQLGNCCGVQPGSFDPGVIIFDVNSVLDGILGDGYNACTNVEQNVTPLITDWYTGNSAIATASSQTAKGVSPGLTTLDGQGITVDPNCTIVNFQESPGSITVQPVIQFQGQTVNGETQSVVVGQQIALTADYTPPSGLTVKSRQWTVAGTTVGGFNTGNTNGGSTTATLTNDAATFYWVTSGNSLNVGFTVTFSDNSTASASTKFNVAGPSSPSVVTKVGTINTLNNTKLVLGGSGSNIGIEFTPSASAPSGYSNTWVYVQLIDSLTIKLINSKTITCVGSGLDGTYPYPPVTNTYTNDNPGVLLNSSYSEESDDMAAHMYVMWSSGLANSIPVPLGYVSWNWFGDATYNSQAGIWSIQPSSSATASAFQPSTTYPSWTTYYPKTSTCP